MDPFNFVPCELPHYLLSKEQKDEEALRFALGKLATDDDPSINSGQQWRWFQNCISYV